MKHAQLILLLLVCLILASCRHSESKPQQEATPPDSVINEPAAKLSIPLTADIGVFTSDNIKKSTSLELANIGNDTLYVMAVLPQCDCTEATLLDSVIPPFSSTILTAVLDLSGYPVNERIGKSIDIISNSKDNRITTITLFGEIR